MTRREFIGGMAVAATAQFRDDTLKLVASITRDDHPDPTDEKYWQALRSAFFIHPSLVVLNNVGVAPSPRRVVEATERELRRAASDPSFVMWREQDKELEPIVKDLSLLLDCKPEEIVLCRNATFGLHTTLLGLHMKQGEEILLPSHEYPRSFTGADQRHRRDGVVVVTAELGGDAMTAEDLAKKVLAAITPRTKLVVLSHVSYLIGQIQPIAAIAAECAKFGIPVLADGAQAIGLLSDTFPQLKASMYAACLHKWMMGPVGTGLFVVKSRWIGEIWPMNAADAPLDEKITKFEQIGTHPTAPYLALREAIDLHHQIGQPAKFARLAYLRHHLVERLVGRPKIHLHSSLDPAVCMPFLTLGIEGKTGFSIADELMSKHRIHVTTTVRAGVNGIRISPNLFTTLDEIDRVGTAIRDMAG